MKESSLEDSNTFNNNDKNANRKKMTCYFLLNYFNLVFHVSCSFRSWEILLSTTSCLFYLLVRGSRCVIPLNPVLLYTLVRLIDYSLFFSVPLSFIISWECSILQAFFSNNKLKELKLILMILICPFCFHSSGKFLTCSVHVILSISFALRRDYVLLRMVLKNLAKLWRKTGDLKNKVIIFVI